MKKEERKKPIRPEDIRNIGTGASGMIGEVRS